jgi:hypothetical protein
VRRLSRPLSQRFLCAVAKFQQGVKSA